MIRGLPWRFAGFTATAAALLALRAFSLWPLGAPAPGATLRLSWSARPERIETCRTLTDAELAARPAHMRLRTVCEGRFAAYRLSVTIDGRPVATETVRGGGLRSDRPIQLLRDLPVEPGDRTVRVSLERIDSTGVAPDSERGTEAPVALGDRAQREADERRRRAAEALPPVLHLEAPVRFARGRVVMITYLNEQRRLDLRGGIP